jgi:fatty acid desaturase
MDIDAIAIRGLDREIVRQLSRRSDARGLPQLIRHGVLLFATGLLVWASRGSLWLAPAIVLHGLVLNFLFCARHETIHRTAFASRWANDSVAWVCGALLLLPPDYFRLFHFGHHRFTQDPARDPELAQPRPSSVGSYLWQASGLPNWYKRLTVTLRHAVTGRVPEPFVPPATRPLVIREARILWACYLMVLAISVLLRRADVLIYWVLPAIAGQPFLRLFRLSEHAGCAFSDDMFANTRTTYTNGATRLLAWQMSYHVEHHAFPSIPFHALAKVNALVRDRIEVTAPGYLALHRDLLRQYRMAKTTRNEVAQ